jgi:Flp pilus assembly protein TadG
MCAPFRTALRRLCADESGQSLIIVALSMTVVIAISAFAIDVGSWYAKHHQAQVVADSAALAAANCLANPGHSTTMNIQGTVTAVPACANGTDTANATTVAKDYAAANGVTINANQVTVNTTSDTVLVNASPAAPAFFANLFGIHSSTQTANSEAGWKATSTPSACTAATASQCAAIYAGNNQSCASTGAGVQFGSSGGGGLSITITGVVHSEDALTFPNNQGTFTTSSMTVAGNCYTTSTMPHSNTVTATQVASEPWPVDYSAAPYFTACTTNCITLQGISGVPPYCTQVSQSLNWNFSYINGIVELPVNGNVYCAVGSGNVSKPSTWNGSINFEGSMPLENQAITYSGCSSFTTDTFIGGNVNFAGANNGGDTVCMKPYLDNCLIYSTGAVGLEDGNISWAGDIFAPGPYLNATNPNPALQMRNGLTLPYGTIQFGASQGMSASAVNGMLEGWNVIDYNGGMTMTGDGPPATVTGGGSNSNGTDSLLQ